MNFPISTRVRVAGVAGLVAGALTTSVALSSPAGMPTSRSRFHTLAAVVPFDRAETIRGVAAGRAAIEESGDTAALDVAATPDADAQAEAAGRLHLVGRAAASRGAARPTFQWPAPGSVTGPYGERRRHGFHPGIDIDGSTGDPVRAAAAGVVIVAGPAPSGYTGYGNLVAIDHGGGLVTLYAHLSRIAVRNGQLVDTGDLVGAIGTSGHVTGSHLHFELRRNGAITNPTPYLAAR